MNILLISPEYPPVNIGGGGVVYKNLSRQLKGKGHFVKVIAGNFKNKKLLGKVETFFDGEELKVNFVPLLPYSTFKNANSASYTLPTARAFMFVLKELIKNKNSVIHLHGFCHPLIDSTAFTCLLMRRKYLITCHGIPQSPETSGSLTKIGFQLYLSTVERLIVNKASALTTVSAALKKECIRKKLVNKKFSVIPNGTNSSLKKPSLQQLKEVETKYSLKSKQVIFAVGRLGENKGFQFLIDAMKNVRKHMPQAVAIIAGSGPYRAQLEKLIAAESLSDNVQLVGWVNEETKAALYERSDVVVFPSVNEPFGIVLLEALAMHKPLVAFDTESSKEIIGDEGAMFVPAGDSEKLAQVITQVLDDPELKQQLAVNTTKVKTSSWEKITNQYLNVYQNVSKEN